MSRIIKRAFSISAPTLSILVLLLSSSASASTGAADLSSVGASSDASGERSLDDRYFENRMSGESPLISQYFDNRPAQDTRGSQQPRSQPIGQPRGFNHDGGFLLRLSGGIGGARTRSSDDVSSLTLSGLGFDYNFAIGGFIAPNFGLHATLFGWVTPNPRIEAEVGGEVERGRFDGDTTLSMTAFGLGFTYYFMPANVYLSMSAGLGNLVLEDGFDRYSPSLGFAADLSVGKEWWVGPVWGLGIAGGVTVHTVGDRDFDERWAGASVGIRFTATFNP